MKAISAVQHFLPKLADPFERLSESHHSFDSPDASCGGCHVSAEGVFMHATRAWEWFVEELLIDLMAGAWTAHRIAIPMTRNFLHATRVDARNNLLRSRFDPLSNTVTLKSAPARYILMHNPAMVIGVSRYWLTGSTIEQVFLGSVQQIERVMHIRHGIAHGTVHAQAQARAAMMSFDPLRSYSSIGEFLLAQSSLHGTTWMEDIFGNLTTWAVAMSP